MQRHGLRASQALLLCASGLGPVQGISMTRSFGRAFLWTTSCLCPQNSAPMATRPQDSARAMVRNQWADQRTGLWSLCLYIQDKVYYSGGPRPLEQTDPSGSYCCRYVLRDFELTRAERSWLSYAWTSEVQITSKQTILLVTRREGLTQIGSLMVGFIFPRVGSYWYRWL